MLLLELFYQNKLQQEFYNLMIDAIGYYKMLYNFQWLF